MRRLKGDKKENAETAIGGIIAVALVAALAYLIRQTLILFNIITP
jgi:hypothetical protein